MTEKITRRNFLALTAKVTAGAALALSGIGPVIDAFAAETELDVRVLTYHEVGPGKLITDIVSLVKQGCQPISMETYIYALNGDIKIPAGLKTFMVTMDDSRLSQYTSVLEVTDFIQQETGFFVPVTFFALTAFNHLGLPIKDVPPNTPTYQSGNIQYMTKRNVLHLLEKGHYIFNHTIDHADLVAVTDDVRNAQIVLGEENIQVLWDLSGRERTIKTLAYPNGSFNQRLINTVQGLNYDAAFTTQKTTIHTPSRRYMEGRIGMT